MKSGYSSIISALFLAEIAATFESAMLYAALPTLISEFGDPITAGWLVTMHMLIGAAAGVLVGRMGDMFGRKRMTLWMLVMATIGSIMSAATNNFGVVLAGRALQGLSVAVIPLSIGIIRESLSKERVPVAVGLMTTGSGVGVAVGLILGGLIVDNLNWHWLFVVSAILLAASWVAIKFCVPVKPGIPPKEPIDWVEGAAAGAWSHGDALWSQSVKNIRLERSGSLGHDHGGRTHHGLLGTAEPSSERAIRRSETAGIAECRPRQSAYHLPGRWDHAGGARARTHKNRVELLHVA